jgi:predicted secreted hydrolase
MIILLQRPILLVLILVLLSTSFHPQAIADGLLWYQPRDAAPYDNTYNTTSYYAAQWWYIDAMLNNSYSVHVGISTVGAHSTSGFFLLQINIYLGGSLLVQRFQLLPLSSLTLPTDDPIISYQGYTILRTFLNDTNHLCITINLRIKDLGVSLLFTGTTPGWIGDTGRGIWGCPLPKATVNGTLYIKEKNIPVHGIGYQEHGWNIRSLPHKWQWGKFSSEHFNVIFSRSMDNPLKIDMIYTIINTNSSYISINPHHIRLQPLKTIWSHGRFIPVVSSLEVHEELYTIHVIFVVQTIQYQHLLIIRYWRFHVHVIGYVTVNEVTEPVDETQIMEVFTHL